MCVCDETALNVKDNFDIQLQKVTFLINSVQEPSDVDILSVCSRCATNKSICSRY